MTQNVAGFCYRFQVFSVIIRTLIPALVLLFFAWARRYVPQQQREPSNRCDDIDSAGVTGYVAGAQILAGLAFFCGTFLLCKALNRHIALTRGTPQLLFPADGIFWLFLSLFGGITLLWEIIYRLWHVFDADAADAYVAYSDAKTGFGVTRVLRWLAVLVTLPVAIATIFRLPIHASFYPDGFWLGRFAQFTPEFHLYSSVQSFRLVDGDIGRNGSFTARPRLLLTFEDGSRWDSFSTREDHPVDPHLVVYLTTNGPSTRTSPRFT